ncbi:hypothetical protein CVIRNUC_003255 [Coccomyxa viridis]|uniref:Helicase ATP-binding domain-containing protein n=1 Tax=Coccomyxa viridis TaxID=1274662 RepID=A0AAV1I1S9_9CHLO|nr:hypothetical protein CVIRNUC_003255 [Coccomyxa viridis]
MSLAILPYQNVPVKHLLIRCPQQKGALVYYQSGSGKSLTGFSFIAALTKLEVFILLPAYLRDVWLSEAKKFGVDLRKKMREGTLTFVSFAALPALLKKRPAASLKDTALLCDEAHNLVELLEARSIDAAFEMVKWLRGFRKIMLLTGTPVYTHESDLRLLINVAAGKELVPMHEGAFQRRYYKTSRLKSFWYGWVVSFLSRFLYQAKDVAGMAINVELVLNPDGQGIAKQLTTLKDFLKNILNTSGVVSAVLAVSVPVFAPIVILAFLRAWIGNGLQEIRYLDGDRFARDVSSYVAFYTIPQKDIGNVFPHVKITHREVDYSPEQTDFWLRFTIGQLTGSELSQISLSKTPEAASFFGEVTQLNDYKHCGRVIGNLGIDRADSPKFCAILASITAGGRTAQTVVFSNFYEHGILKFSAFLKAKGAKHRVLTPSMAPEAKDRIVNGFRDRKVQIVLLHPSFTEGLSLLGAEQMHILEPILHPAMEEQVIARVSRYKSHDHLPGPERRVHVSIWICTVRTVLARLRKKSIQHRMWAEYQPWIGPWEQFSRFPQDVTPDSLFLLTSNLIHKNIRAIKQGLTKHSIATLRIAKDPTACRLPLEDDARVEAAPTCERF